MRSSSQVGEVTSDAGNFAQFMHRFWYVHRTTQPTRPEQRGDGLRGACRGRGEARRATAHGGRHGRRRRHADDRPGDRHRGPLPRAPIIVVVFQNGLHGTYAMHQARAHGRLSGVSIGLVDFASWARGLGAAGYTVDDRDELVGPIIASALVRQRPCVIDIRTDPDVVTPDVRLSSLLGASRPAQQAE